MTALFVTATGTEIGKTYVTAGLIRAVRARGLTAAALKPVASGYDPDRAAESDAGALLAALGLAATPDAVSAICPWRFARPLSPDMAARHERRRIDLDAVVAFCRATMAESERLLIEGVGGVMVPLDDRQGVLDWAAALGCPALLVAGSYLGTISHSLTALAVLRARGVPVLALVVNETAGSSVGMEDTVAALARLVAPCPVLGVLRGGGTATFEQLATLWLG